MNTSDYYACVERFDDRRLWMVCRRGSRLTGVGATVVWSGISTQSCRRALAEFREWERHNTRHWPKVATSWRVNPN